MTHSNILQDLKYKHGFPPRDRVQEIRNQFASRNTSGSSMEAQAIARAYRDTIEAIMKDFTEIIVNNAGKLGLKTPEEMEAVITTHLTAMFTEGRGHIVQELERWSSDDLTRRGMAVLDEKFEELGSYLRGKVQLRDLIIEPTGSSVR